eukprot:SAG11_NODE_4167_length_2029_cov_0.897927_2_plen_280_part_00
MSAIQASEKQCAYRELYDPWIEPFCALRNRLHAMAAAQHSRLTYWCGSFKYMRTLAAVDCAWFNHRAATATLAATPNASRLVVARTVALPARIAMLSNLSAAVTLLLSTVSTVGEIGMLSHILNGAAPMMLDNQTELQLLSSSLGHELPAEALPSPKFVGEPRIFVPSIRPLVESGAPLEICACVLSPQPPTRVWLQWRPLHNDGRQLQPVWSAAIPMEAVLTDGTQVYSATMVAPEDDFEWMVSAQLTTCGANISFPASAPASGEYVVIWDHKDRLLV